MSSRISKVINATHLVIGNVYKQKIDYENIPNPPIWMQKMIEKDNKIQGKLLSKDTLLYSSVNANDGLIYSLRFEGLETPVSVLNTTQFYVLDEIVDEAPASEFSYKQREELDKISKNANMQAVNTALYTSDMKNCGEQLRKILSDAFSKVEKTMGRPMTYSEMRERFG